MLYKLITFVIVYICNISYTIHCISLFNHNFYLFVCLFTMPIDFELGIKLQ